MTDDQKLYLSFHGRIIDSLGIQMYQVRLRRLPNS